MALTGAVLGGTLTFAISAAATVILLYFLLASEYWMLSRTIEAIPRRRTRALVLSGVRARSARSAAARALALSTLASASPPALAMSGLGLEPDAVGRARRRLNFIPYIGPLIMCALLLVAGLLTFDGAARCSRRRRLPGDPLRRDPTS